jgi:hypothetical protein
VAEGVYDVWPSFREVVTKAVASPNPVHVRHLALDLGDAWDLLRDGVLNKENIKNVTWRCLMIDPDSPEITAADSASVSREAARQAINKIEQTFSQLKVKQRRMHGFSVEDHALLLSMCDIDEEGKLDAVSTPYFRFNAKETTHSQHVISSFEHWFEYRWSRASRQIWPQP